MSAGNANRNNIRLSKQFLESADAPKIEMFPGFWRQTLVYGPSLMLCLFTLRKGACLPERTHPHIQAGYLISGGAELTVAGDVCVMRPGSSYMVASNQPHSARAIEDSLVIDVFSPCREEYIP